METNFKEIKNDVLSFYDEMINTVNKCKYPNNDDTTLKSLASQYENIKEDRFCLLIAGEAKSGKSTFINAYLGTEILPMDVKQCTSAIVEIAYGENFHLEATYADDGTETIWGEESISRFLKENVSLDDKYRDIPVTTINHEIIIKYKDQKISESVIKDLIEGVKQENIHHLSESEYEQKIRNYIREKQPHWKEMVVKIDIYCPFKDKNMKGVRIIDSPGVNAAGKVGDVTDRYIESADAIMFLRPITGQAIEANSFKGFLESKSVDRNKNAMFLVLTRIASEPHDTIKKAYEEFVNIFGAKSDTGHGIVKEQIIPVDSKAKLYFNKFEEMSTPEIIEYINQLDTENKLDPFLDLASTKSLGDKDELQKKLMEISKFDRIDQALNSFGRKAQFIALSEFLERILKIYARMESYIKDNISNYSLKAKDPEELAKKILETQKELVGIENRLNREVDKIAIKYGGGGNKGLISQKAEKVMAEFQKEIKKLDADENSSIDDLEIAAFRKVDTFIEFQNSLQKKVVDECNEALKVALSDKSTIEFTTLEPDFTPEIVEEIKSNVKKESNESYTYTAGVTFKKVHKGSRFSQKRYYQLFSNSISERLESIKEQAVRDLRSFVVHTVGAYTKELAHNADQKRKELEKIKKEKKDADEIQTSIKELQNVLSLIEPAKKKIEESKGGIDKIV